MTVEQVLTWVVIGCGVSLSRMARWYEAPVRNRLLVWSVILQVVNLIFLFTMLIDD